MSEAPSLVSFSAIEVARGIDFLRLRDPVMARVMDRAGPFSLTPERDLFKSLVRAIVAQQISTSAARSIYQRLITATGGEDQLLPGLRRLAPEELRAAGFSNQKQRYMRDLAANVAAGTVRIDALPAMANDEVIAELTQVVGVGKWTVQMLLIFSLGRLNVFPGDDLGVRTAIKKLYRKRLLPKPKQLSRFEKLWQPYASIASWYCWRSLEFKDGLD
jgi:DNA-3-methyladenine glycosylase II